VRVFIFLISICFISSHTSYAQEEVSFPDLVVVKPNKEIRCEIITITNIGIIIRYPQSDTAIVLDTISGFKLKTMKEDYFTTTYGEIDVSELKPVEAVSVVYVGANVQFPIVGREAGFEGQFFPEQTKYDETINEVYKINRVYSYGGGIDYWYSHYRSIRVSGFYSQINHERTGVYVNYDTALVSSPILDSVLFKEEIKVSYVKTEIMMNFTSDVNKNYVGFFGIGSTHNFLINGVTKSTKSVVNLKNQDLLSPVVIGGILSIGGMYRYQNLVFSLNIMGEIQLNSTPVERFTPNRYLMLNGGIKLFMGN
jgi:hypothetical protein